MGLSGIILNILSLFSVVTPADEGEKRPIKMDLVEGGWTKGICFDTALF